MTTYAFLLILYSMFFLELQKPDILLTNRSDAWMLCPTHDRHVGEIAVPARRLMKLEACKGAALKTSK